MRNKQRKTKSGYTIIETMIAISLFLIIIMIGMGALLNANLLHNKSKDMRSIIDNLSFIMEDMSRNLRTGYDYRCITSEPDFSSINIDTPKSSQDGQSCWGIALEYQNGATDNPGDQWVYYIGAYNNKDGIFKSTDGASSFVQLNSDEVKIDLTDSSFTVTGAELGDNKQPFVTIKLVGKITYKNNVESPFSLQTSVSQRTIDI
ncbi:MAG: prepilin-type N-terminal cleavage/methylation domain-containing protein [Candidatus Paceibacterota bacterium]